MKPDIDIADRAESSLRNVFSNAIHPGDERLLREGAVDLMDVEMFLGKSHVPWWELDPAELNLGRACLSALSDSGLYYVIPAYVLMSVRKIPDDFGWSESVLILIRDKGRGQLTFSKAQFDVLEDLFFAPLEARSLEFDSAIFGMSHYTLVNQIRANKNRESGIGESGSVIKS